MEINETDKEEINEEKLERELVNITEYIDNLEGIFLDYGNEIDANLLSKRYDEYLNLGSRIQDFRGGEPIRIKERKKDIEKYLNKIDSEKIRYRGYLSRKWKNHPFSL